MSLNSNASFAVADSGTESANVTATVMPAVGYGTGGLGRLVHPTLGTYDYQWQPDQRVNVHGDVIYTPEWLHSKTLGASALTLASGKVQDPIVIERWNFGDGMVPLALVVALLLFVQNPTDVDAGSYITWSPNYANSRTWRVAVVGLRVGGEQVTIDSWLATQNDGTVNGYTVGPCELALRIISEV